MELKFIDFQIHGDERGQLIALEENINIPFPIKRVYFMYDTKLGVHRGMHAHKSLQQVLFCVSGSCMIRLDDGKERKEVKLDKPEKGLFIGPGIWREMFDFQMGTVLMVVASEYYNESDYIRDYQDFLNDSSLHF